jgi:hypothetical protein
VARDHCRVKIFICASRSNYSRVASIQRELTRRGHVVTLPNNYDDPGREERIKSASQSEYRLWKARMLELQGGKVEANDALLVLNFDKGEARNYLGGATFLEIFKAWELGRRIFLFNPLPDGILRDELYAMSPVVIDGDLSLVS